MRDRWIKYLCIVMAVVLPASMVMADTRAAMMYASGNALLNGVNVARSSAVFVGDKIQTSQNAAATINANGSSVLVPASSTVQYKGDAIQIDNGGAVITTTKGLKAQVDNLTVAPAQGTAKFEVSRSQGKVLIASKAGTLAITSALGTTYVASGATATVDPQDQKGGAAPSVGTTTTTAAGGGIGMATGIAIGVGLAAAGIAAAAAWLSGGNQPSPVSPRNP